MQFCELQTAPRSYFNSNLHKLKAYHERKIARNIRIHLKERISHITFTSILSQSASYYPAAAAGRPQVQLDHVDKPRWRNVCESKIVSANLFLT